MRPWSRVALVVLCAGAASSSLSAQPELIGLEKVHQLFTAGQARAASRELSLVSVEFRNEIGRCKDESIGARLMELEPKVDALAKGINSGAVTSAAMLEKEFAVIDQLLAENHQQLASGAWALRRFGRLEGVAADLGVAARYATRAGRWAHKPLNAELQKAIDDALAVSAKITADPANPPAETNAVIDALGKALKAAP
jgi:hypothetical protein